MIQVHYIYYALYFCYYYIVIYYEIIMQLTIMQNQWEPWACFHLPLADRVLIWACKTIDLLWSLCSQTSLLVIICICSHSPALVSPPQLHLSSSGIGFSWGVHNLDPSHAQFTVGFELLWESNAVADLTGGGAQAITRAMGSGCKYRGSFAWLPTARLPPLAVRPCSWQATDHYWFLAQGLGTPALSHTYTALSFPP